MINNDPISVDILTACRMSGLSRSFLYEVLAHGTVRSVKAGRRRLVLVESLKGWLQSLPNETPFSNTGSNNNVEHRPESTFGRSHR